MALVRMAQYWIPLVLTRMYPQVRRWSDHLPATDKNAILLLRFFYYSIPITVLVSKYLRPATLYLDHHSSKTYVSL